MKTSKIKQAAECVIILIAVLTATAFFVASIGLTVIAFYKEWLEFFYKEQLELLIVAALCLLVGVAFLIFFNRRFSKVAECALTLIVVLIMVAFFVGAIALIILALEEKWFELLIAAALCLLVGIGFLIFLKGGFSIATKKERARIPEIKAEMKVYELIADTLYKRVGSQLHYWATWVENKKKGEEVILFEGVVGEHGQGKKAVIAPHLTALETARAEFEKKRRQGYAPFDEKEKIRFAIIYQAEKRSQDKLHRRLQTLFWRTGVGEIDSHLADKENITIHCWVVDFEIAKELIEKELAGTEFQNFEIRMI